MAKNKPVTVVADLPAPGPVDNTQFQVVSDFLTEQGWNHSSDQAEAYFWFMLRLKDGSVRVIVDVAPASERARLQVFATLPVFVPQARRAAVSEALIRINRRSAFASFDLDLHNGEVRARAVLENDAMISTTMIERTVCGALDLADQYFAALLAVAFGHVAPDTILEMGSRSEGTPLQ
ncbi:YbjN domain-containing protein [Comamonadaceae bacterium G21597-S1]|nr:YbjN domain-containing protein [Comamonadaceae bacterium G21597-S1]